MLFTLTSKVFVTISYNITIDKMTKYGLDKWTVKWFKNWLNHQTQRVATSVTKLEGSHQGSAPGANTV